MYVSAYIATRSQTVAKNISDCFEIYAHKIGYLEYIRSLQRYLEKRRSIRVGEIKKIIRKNQRNNEKNINKFSTENIRRTEEEFILLEELFQELKKVDEIVVYYSTKET